MKKRRKIFFVITLLCIVGFSQINEEEEFEIGIDKKVFVYNKKFTNVFVIQKNDHYLMIDSGLPNRENDLLKFLKKKNIDPSKIDYIILTHGHPDHAGGAAFFQKQFGTKIIAGKGDVDMIEKGGFDEHLCPRGLQGKYINRTIASQRYTSFQPDILIEDAFDLKQLGWEGRIENFKSHTAGSLVVFMENIAFVGDLIKGKNLNKDQPTFHIFMCDLSDNLKDIEAVAKYEEIEKWYLGHFGPLDRKDVLKFIEKKKKKYD